MQTEMQLCDPKTGMVEGAWLDQHHRLKRETTAADAPFACTGSACYVFGEHIRCTSEIHKKPVPAPATLQHRHEGLALVRVANDVRDHFAGDADVPQDFLDDLDTIEQVGRRMYFSRPITLAAGVSLSSTVLRAGA